jgi:uncharacterized protein YceK
MFRTLPASLFIVIAIAPLSACSTVNTLSHSEQGSPRVFSGTRLNIAAMSDDADSLANFAAYDMRPVEYPFFDLPFSLAADLVLLPVTVGVSVSCAVCVSLPTPNPIGH